MNEFKPQQPDKKPGTSRIRRLHEFDFRLNKENAPKIIPLVLFICLWAIVYIANHHYGEKTLSTMDKLRKQLKDQKADFYTINKELSNKSIQSEVSKSVADIGLKELTTPPVRFRLIEEKEDER